MTTFNDLSLSPALLQSITEMGFQTPSEIQQRSIPILSSEDKDFIGLAQTGTGKTAAFGLPLLDKIDPKQKQTQALILAPTRELGQQIAEQLKIFGKFLNKINMLAVYGGASIVDQMRSLKQNPHIIIATPGRLHDLIRRKAARLESIRYLILDEADEMLNMGFKEDLDAILENTPSQKKTWLFSATMPQYIKKIVNSYMNHPVEVKVDQDNQVNTNIGHFYVKVQNSDKAEALMRFLDMEPDMRGLVFCRTKNETQNLTEHLIKKQYRVDCLHGDLSQQQRDRVMKRFKARDLHILIATDVAARGIDVNDLTHVFHYSLPDGKEFYTHRSGRTARAGKKGKSVAFIGGREINKILHIEKQLKIKFEQSYIPDARQVKLIRIEKWCQNIIEADGAGTDDFLVKKADNMLMDYSKRDLLKLLISSELSDSEKGSSRDLNIKGGDSPVEKPGRRKPSGNFSGKIKSPYFKKRKRVKRNKKKAV